MEVSKKNHNSFCRAGGWASMLAFFFYTIQFVPVTTTRKGSHKLCQIISKDQGNSTLQTTGLNLWGNSSFKLKQVIVDTWLSRPLIHKSKIENYVQFPREGYFSRWHARIMLKILEGTSWHFVDVHEVPMDLWKTQHLRHWAKCEPGQKHCVTGL